MRLNKAATLCILKFYFVGQIYCRLNFTYHSNEEIVNILKDFEKDNSNNLRKRLYSIGFSSQPQKPFKLYSFELSAAPSQTGIPNVKLIGNLHGNEAGGREILLHFIEYLIDEYNKDDNVTWLLNNTKIHIIPTINPDGFASASNACNSTMGRDVPTNHVDLNRNFPDYFLPDPDLILAKESTAVMDLMNNTTFILSAALHEGAMVVNYPYDINPYNQNSKFLTPDNDVFYFLAKTYSDNHLEMHSDKECPQVNKVFKNGITNGAEWYSFPGGMGDYNYNFHGCMELTLELSCCKYPRGLLKLWNDNKKALVQYCMQANRGVTGLILDSKTKNPIEAKLKIMGRDKVLFRKKKHEIYFKSSKNTGEFWRILLPGNYILQVKATGYYTQHIKFTVKEHKPFPKLTNITVLLINSSIPTTTSTTSTTEMQKSYPFLTSRLDESVNEFNISTKGLTTAFANNNKQNWIMLVYIIVLLSIF